MNTKAEKFLLDFTIWIKRQSEILAVALVGSYARGDEKSDSDIDLVIITDNTKVYLDDDRWAENFGRVTELKKEDYQLVQERRVFYDNGLEVEYGITTPEWVKIDPVEPGTRKVITDGAKILYDKSGILQNLFRFLEFPT